jgi:hypothetical protein
MLRSRSGGQQREEELQAALQQYKQEYISPAAEIGLEQVWAARSELARVQKTNAQPEAIQSSLKDVLIGRVPDRGGRVDAASGANKMESQGARRDAAVAIKCDQPLNSCSSCERARKQASKQASLSQACTHATCIWFVLRI